MTTLLSHAGRWWLLLLAVTTVQAHDHYSAGILDTNGNLQADPGEPLRFVGTTGEAKVFHLLPRPVGFRPVQRCGGYYMLDERPRTLFPLDSFSLTALSDGQVETAVTFHAHTGAQIWVEITGLKGPAGGEFGFWEENWSLTNDTPTKSFAANQPTGNYQFVLSESSGEFADEDPQGHIHGRSWTATKPGDYYLTFRLVDRSTNRPGGQPWHTPSPSYTYHFVAGPSFQPKISGAGNVLTWASQMGTDNGDLPPQTGVVFTILRATSLAPANWEPLGTVTGTTANTATFTDPTPPVGQAFYKLQYDWSAP